MMNKTLAQAIASRVVAIDNCTKSGNHEWKEKHTAAALALVDSYIPSGSGLDNGVTLDLEKSSADRLVLHTSFHHMDEGSYCGWTDHTVTVRASLAFGVDVHISGRNRNDIKDYLVELFSTALEREIEE